MASTIEELTECMICAEPFKDPQSLPCLHTFCKKCVDRMIRGERIKCPTCNAVSGVESIKADFRVQKIVEALEQAAQLALAQPTAQPSVVVIQSSDDGLGKHCGVCRGDDVAFWCDDCRYFICESCRIDHGNIPGCENNRVMAVSNKAKVTKVALQTKVGRIVQIQIEFQDAVRKCQAGVDDANGVQVAALKACSDLRKLCQQELDSYFDSLHAQIIDIVANAVANFDAQLKQSKETLDKIIAQKEELERIIAHSDNMIVTEGDSLIKKAIGLLESVSSPDIDIQVPVVRVERNLNWKKVEAATLNLSDITKQALTSRIMSTEECVEGAVGGIELQAHTSPSSAQYSYGQKKHNKLKLRDISGKQWMKLRTISLSCTPNTLRVVNQQLWCCGLEAGILVFNTDLNWQGTIPCGDVGSISDVADIGHGDVAIAADNGLYTISSNSHPRRQDSKAFACVIFHEDRLFATRQESDQIREYSCYNGKWRKCFSFDACADVGDDDYESECLTLSVNNNTITSCCMDYNEIRVHSREGDMLDTYTYRRCGDGPGEFNCPYICDDDKQGNVLIADFKNDRLQVMTNQGDFSVVEVRPRVSQPISAVLFKNHIYVVSVNGNTLTKLSYQ